MKKSDLKNGMIVTLRRGVERVVIAKNLLSYDVVICNTLDNYKQNLTHINNCTSEDIMKIEYGDKVIWKRVDWKNVPFGTKVRVWDDEEDDKQVCRFLCYDKNDGKLPFFVFIEGLDKAWWFKNCEIIKEDE